MSAITADMVKELREKTGAAMMDCKKALSENAGNLDAAVKWLREKGIAGAEKKAGRATAEGLAGLKVEGNKGVIVEVNCETDFVAKTDKFQALVADAADAALKASLPADAAAAAAALNAAGMETKVKDAIAGLGENMALARALSITVKQGVLGSYRHSDGKLAAVVALECGKADTAAKAEVIELARNLAMQVAGNLPPAEVVSRDQISPELIAREKEIAVTQAAQAGAGKPQNIIDKIAEGKVNKVLQEITLLEQPFIMDGNVKIADLLKQAGAKVGDALSISAFIRIKVGVK